MLDQLLSFLILVSDFNDHTTQYEPDPGMYEAYDNSSWIDGEDQYYYDPMQGESWQATTYTAEEEYQYEESYRQDASPCPGSTTDTLVVIERSCRITVYEESDPNVSVYDYGYESPDSNTYSASSDSYYQQYEIPRIAPWGEPGW